MRLLTISPSTHRGGVEEYALTIATAAVKKGWEVHAAFPKNPQTNFLSQDFIKKGVHYHCLEIAEVDVGKFRTAKKYLPQLAETVSLLLKIKPSVVQVNLPWLDQCFGSILACAVLKIPTVVVFHLTPFSLSINKTKLQFYTWIRSKNQQWVAVSENNRKIVCESFHIPDNQVNCIYNGTKIMPEAINSATEEIRILRCQIRQKLGVSQTSKLALTIGRLDLQKGYSDIVRIIPCIVKEFPDLKFVWVGDGEQREYLINQVREYGVEDKVLFLGYRSDVPKLLKSADLFIFPTHYEGHPFVLLEAMACNLPIVASDASAILELIEHRVHGLLFRTGDSNDLLLTLRWALKHPNYMQQLAQNAQLRVQDFSEEKMIKETLTVLRQLSREL